MVDDSNLLVLIVYVDNLIFIGSLEKFIAWCKIELVRGFDMKDIGLIHYFLALEVMTSTMMRIFLMDEDGASG